MGLAGTFRAKQKNGKIYFRSSITYRNRHISLGSYPTEEQAHSAYMAAADLLGFSSGSAPDYQVEDYPQHGAALPFEKWVILLNFRDNGIYSHTPLYLHDRFFLYYLDVSTPLKFDADDLFYYMRHKILRRGSHLFVSDYGLQVSLLSRYGIHSHAVAGRDYRFVNGDNLDYRYGNIEIINRYYGVFRSLQHGRDIYTAKIHINGDYIIGRYSTEQQAAAAYNKAVDLLHKKGVQKNFPQNFIEELSGQEYAKLYADALISRKIKEYGK